jgi:hypothetical protein
VARSCEHGDERSVTDTTELAMRFFYICELTSLCRYLYEVQYVIQDRFSERSPSVQVTVKIQWLQVSDFKHHETDLRNIPLIPAER